MTTVWVRRDLQTSRTHSREFRARFEFTGSLARSEATAGMQCHESGFQQWLSSSSLVQAFHHGAAFSDALSHFFLNENIQAATKTIDVLVGGTGKQVHKVDLRQKDKFILNQLCTSKCKIQKCQLEWVQRLKVHRGVGGEKYVSSCGIIAVAMALDGTV